MKQVTPVELRYINIGASFNSNPLDFSAFNEVQVFIKVVALSTGSNRTVAISNVQACAAPMSGRPDGNYINLDVSKFTVEGTLPAAIGTVNAVAAVTLIHVGMWTRLAFSIGGTTGTIDFTVYILGKD